jgi:hypothetical protein
MHELSSTSLTELSTSLTELLIEVKLKREAPYFVGGTLFFRKYVMERIFHLYIVPSTLDHQTLEN